jgi:hypothetical protein
MVRPCSCKVSHRLTALANGTCILLERVRLRLGDVSAPGQSHLIHPCQNALEIGGVPSSLEPLGMNTNPRRVFLAQQIEANMAEHCQIFVSMALSNARFIFPKREIQDPMHTVFNTLVASHRVGKGVHGRETEQKVAGFPRDLVI